MFERFTREARAMVVQAREEAAALGAPAVEAEHLLLALAGGSTRAGAALAGVGLDHDGVLAALGAEREQALAAVGVSAPKLGPTSARVRTDGLGTSAKLVLRRALEAAVARHDGAILSEHLLLGVLAAGAGTVPRALATAGVEPEVLAAQLTRRPAA